MIEKRESINQGQESIPVSTSECGMVHQYLDGQSSIEEPEKREITLNSKSARRYEDQAEQSNQSQLEIK